MTTSIRRSVATCAAAALTLLAPLTISAQTAGPRWSAFQGCWTATRPGQSLVDFKTAPVVCVAPTSNPNAVELTTLGETKVLGRDTIDASGTAHTFATKSCTGSQTANWSSDQRRVYLKSVSVCDGLKSTTSAILGMTPNGDWLDVRAVSAGGGENVRVARYRSVQMPGSLADSVASADKAPIAAARIAAGAPIGSTAIAEALRTLDASVVEAWILERGQAFNLDAKGLTQLAEAGFPGRVTDAMIAITYPSQFELARADVGGGSNVITTREDGRGNQVYAGTMTPVSCDRYSRYYDPQYCRDYGSYGNNSYGGYGYGYGYGYGSGYGGYNGGYLPVVVVVSPSSPTIQHGQVVKGQGYTQPAGTVSNGASSAQSRPSTSTSSPSSGAASTSSTSGSGSSTSTSTTNSSSGDRTAHGRP